MNERAIFSGALDRDTPDARAAYLDEACGGDPALRERVEALLRSHEEAGEFPGKLAPQRLADEFAARESDDTRTGPSASDADEGLDFLAPSDSPGSLGRIGHYEVQEVVGRGGMGVVLKAFDERLHRVVAIKVMAPQLAASATARRRFTREARAAAAVTHDHVVTIHAVEDAGLLPYIVMQFVSGVSLQDRIDRTGPLQLHEVLRIGTQAALGLAAAHAQGLVHRDVKPANILLENGVERVRLTDFGLARAADDASLTQSGMIAGTPSFMSPEQAEGKSVDHRSDLFSLGSVLYTMCAGRPPFRAGTGMGVLKRVCEETPTPIGQINPEAPEWLAAVVEKLHAKDPVARFQSAAEVAEVLGRHLAQVQHPSVVPLPAVVKSVDGPSAPARRSHGPRWAAAAVLVAVLAVLGATEAAGVTKVRATVIRIFTPDGTLVVETDDPDVKITIEGNGDLVITGAGAQEVRLRPGSYKVKALKDGKPVKLDHDLITITRGDRQVVRVRIEGEPSVPAANVEKGAFVVTGGKGVAERKFDTLAEAVAGASDGDTIDVRGNGPFVMDPVDVGTRPLTIRAGQGFRPVIRLGASANRLTSYLLATSAPLVVEGLELHGPGGGDGPSPGLIFVRGGPVHVANCRLVSTSRGYNVWGYGRTAACELRNCVLLTGASPSVIWDPLDGRLVMDNCVLAGGGAVACVPRPGKRDLSFRLTDNTLAGATVLSVTVASPKAVLDGKEAFDPVRLDLSRNVVAGPDSIWLLPAAEGAPLPPEVRAALVPRLPRLLAWREQGNLHLTGHRFLDPHPKTLAEWNRFWGPPGADRQEGAVRFHGGDLVTRARSAPEQLTAEDFRLRPDSAGYRAGPGGKDLGADVDLVGPGAAYERWKKRPEYQQWLKESGQVR